MLIRHAVSLLERPVSVEPYLGMQTRAAFTKLITELRAAAQKASA
jgi:hypothetical protein